MLLAVARRTLYATFRDGSRHSTCSFIRCCLNWSCAGNRGRPPDCEGVQRIHVSCRTSIRDVGAPFRKAPPLISSTIFWGDMRNISPGLSGSHFPDEIDGLRTPLIGAPDAPSVRTSRPLGGECQNVTLSEDHHQPAEQVDEQTRQFREQSLDNREHLQPAEADNLVGEIQSNDDILDAVQNEGGGQIQPVVDKSTAVPVESNGKKLASSIFWHRLVWAYTTVPSAKGWGEAAGALLLFGLVIQPFVYFSNLLNLEKADFAPLLLLKSFFIPCLAEESLFRVLFNPHSREHPTLSKVLIVGFLSVAFFIAWHPFNATFLTPIVRPIFYKTGFLAVVTFLGIVNQCIYFRTGSIWPPVLIHWLLVAVWLTLGGKADVGVGLN